MRAVAVLDDELRRGMYYFIRAARRPVTRDEAATSVGISRKLAAFHLEKLVDAGVLTVADQPVTGLRRVGRAPKVYQPVETDIRISIPPRQHDLLAEILLSAVLADDAQHSDEGRQHERAGGAALRVATERGHRIGRAEQQRLRPGRLGVERALTLTTALLNRHGFEPVREANGCVRLHSCPFHPLAATARELVCGINHRFLAGVLDGLGAAPAVCAVLDPAAGRCCVELRACS
ncbi:MAG: transcriptional regulator [Pseudonocardia sp.]|nr:transcriptional regulator [Pseudonocardia sp.]